MMNIIKPYPSAPVDETLFVYTQLLELLAKQKWTMLWGVVLVSAVLVAIGFHQELAWFWLIWFVLVLLGLVLHYQVRSTPILMDDLLGCQKLIKRNVQLEFVNGLTQALCLCAFPFLTGGERDLFTLILLGMTVGNVTNAAGHTKLYWAFTSPIILSLSFVWLWFPVQNQSVVSQYLTGFLILLPMTPMLWTYANSSWVLFEESCRLRFRERVLNAQLQEALQIAEQANRAKSRFLAAASHDLRQPLHVIGFIGSALKLRQLDDKSAEMVGLLNKASASLQSLLNSLLDVSKLDSGLLEVQLEAVSIRYVVEEFFQSYEPLVVAKGLSAELSISSKGDLLTVTDSVLLLRILNNLGQNALKFTQTGTIGLNIFVVEKEIVIELRDTGCGIALEHQDEVFHEFFQVGNQERDVSQGLGLGLSIVRRVAQLLNIRLQLTSAVGHGTLVRLSVPIVQPSIKQLVLSDMQNDLAHHASHQFDLNVLVIDDESAVLEASRLLLSELGCKCQVASNLNEARECIQKLAPQTTNRPDLIMVDLRLKGEYNGIDVIRLLRQELGEPAVEAFIISGDTDSERLLLAKHANIHICHKPLTLEKLSDELIKVQKRL